MARRGKHSQRRIQAHQGFGSFRILKNQKMLDGNAQPFLPGGSAAVPRSCSPYHEIDTAPEPDLSACGEAAQTSQRSQNGIASIEWATGWEERPCLKHTFERQPSSSEASLFEWHDVDFSLGPGSPGTEGKLDAKEHDIPDFRGAFSCYLDVEEEDDPCGTMRFLFS